MEIIVLFIIAVSLSMDAFSLSLAYGTINLSKNNMLILSIIVGIYHFFMPLVGMLFGNVIINYFPIKPETIVFFVLTIIGIQMIYESFKSKEIVKKMSIFELIMFGFAVSIDSFSVGIGIKAITNLHFLSFLIFSVSSFTFTYLGLFLGNKANLLLGKLSTIIGGFVLIIIGIIYLF